MQNINTGFTYDNSTFYLHGSPYQIIGGQMDPQRVPRQYWEDRLSKARSMGLNTVFSYIYWNKLEPRPGEWDFSSGNDIAAWFELAKKVGLAAVVRPGPYIGAEHEWGGLPSWLQEIPYMQIRRNNAPFINATKSYFDHIGERLGPLQVTNGGPLIMCQVENEFGSFAQVNGESQSSNHQYIEALRDSLRSNFDITLYSTDSGNVQNLEQSVVPGVLAEVDGQAVSGFEARQSFTEYPSSAGPLLDGEYYTTWFDSWGTNATHVMAGGTYFQSLYANDDIQYVLQSNNSISFYMFHGGTNWEFDNSCLWDGNGYLDPVTTSYDYGAPLDESGRVTSLYSTLRSLIEDYGRDSTSLPSIPINVPLMSTPKMHLSPVASLFQNLGEPKVQSSDPMYMEQLNQSYGYVLYEHTVRSAIKGPVVAGDYPRDRIIVFVNGERRGVQDMIYNNPPPIDVSLSPGDTLQLLVENLGRVSFQQYMDDQRKGIVGNVTVSGVILRDWSMYSLPLVSLPSHVRSVAGTTLSSRSHDEVERKLGSLTSPVFFAGILESTVAGDDDSARDTFLHLEGITKGVVYVNGYNIGRYWVIGPQQSLYVPGCFLKRSGRNDVVVLELEPRNGYMPAAQGHPTRIWGNNYDPDAPYQQ
ncbi:hypothetical protein N7474_001693 [Penicillium riverlandense]|uniref:uncharacterized protein n=1 Tax=Penicillium riverlandense TaxID=1903569 RepID=UPI002549C0F1|nr:uncharacterized protein N7474_001693 [Penicillium riverlandense]KAJ5833382.1 hypothetical protein N7474_001693 [Penicillium riverlandense]